MPCGLAEEETRLVRRIGGAFQAADRAGVSLFSRPIASSLSPAVPVQPEHCSSPEPGRLDPGERRNRCTSFRLQYNGNDIHLV